jgi:hypothetical protein
MSTIKKHPVFLAILMLIASATIFSGCKKYEEGPGLSFRSKKARLVNTWEIEQYIENGVDKTAEQKADEDWEMEIQDDGDVIIIVTDKQNPSNVDKEEGKWSLKNDDEQLEMVFPSGIQTFDITRLKSDELWFIYNFEFFGTNHKLEYHLKEK